MRRINQEIQRNVCVFCGSANGSDAIYRETAAALGKAIAEAGLGVVYGGAHVGLMGAVADAALGAGGPVIGVIPKQLEIRELAHTGLTELHVVGTMHERKALMADRADAFLALPGGLGTLDEFFEILTWAQLEIHSKPCLLLNTEGYFDDLLRFLDFAVEREFLKPKNRDRILVVTKPSQVVPMLLRRWRTAGGKARPRGAATPKP